jgi:hypothetical protein
MQASAASRRKSGQVSEASGRQARWAQRCSREVLQVLSEQRADPAQAQMGARVTRAGAQALAQAVQEVGRVPERSSQAAAQRAATQLPVSGAAQHKRTTSGMRRSRLLK